jgi:hypothetical protein
VQLRLPESGVLRRRALLELTHQVFGLGLREQRIALHRRSGGGQGGPGCLRGDLDERLEPHARDVVLALDVSE